METRQPLGSIHILLELLLLFHSTGCRMGVVRGQVLNDPRADFELIYQCLKGEGGGDQQTLRPRDPIIYSCCHG